MKTILTIEVTYDGRKTDPEALASAMDRLLETALSTPGILDEYGSPTMGEFFVAPEKSKPPKRAAPPKVVLSLSGGVVQAVYGDPNTVEVVLVDWDVQGCSPDDPNMVEIPDGKGTRPAAVAGCWVVPMKEIAGTDTAVAIKAAGLDDPAPADESLETTQLWVIYDFDLKELATTTVYDSYEEAAACASELNNVLVLPLTIESVTV
jgi:hypothetical protein